MWPVPIRSDGKAPLYQGFGVSKPSERFLEQAWSEHPDAGLALLSGPQGGIIDIDIDDPDIAGPGLDRLFDGQDPRTWRFRSRRGDHYLFRWDDRLSKLGAASSKWTHELYPGIELRIGGYGKQTTVVIPPTPPRRWIDETELRPLPEFTIRRLIADLTPRINAPAPKAPTCRFRDHSAASRELRVEAYIQKMDPAREGDRGHDVTYRGACNLKGFALDEGELYRYLCWYNEAKCFPFWSEKELLHKASEAARKAREGFGCKLDEGQDQSYAESKRWRQDVVQSMKLAPNIANPKPIKPALSIVREDEFEGAPPPPPPPPPVASASQSRRDQRRILVEPHQSKVIDAALDSLIQEDRIFQRGHALVDLLTPTRSEEEEMKATTIRATPSARLSEILSDNARYVQEATTRTGEVYEKELHVPAFVVSGLEARGHWPTVRHLTNVVEAPTMRRDGTILDVPGYDRRTGLYYSPNADFLRVPESPTKADALEALKTLISPFDQFYWKDEPSKSAWVSLVLTLIVRYAIASAGSIACVPTFLIDANMKGSGKGKIANSASLIAFGRPMSNIGYTPKEEELEKRLDSAAIDGLPVAFFDNVTSPIGGRVVEALTTSTLVSPRFLGESRIVRDIPWCAVIVFTGNNCKIKGDVSRRLIRARLQCPLEKPHRREDLKIRDIEKHVKTHRAELHRAALTMVRAFDVAGRPSSGLAPLGSYEIWSELVRDTVIWLGLPDPVSTQDEVVKEDLDEEIRRTIIEGFRELPRPSVGYTSSEILNYIVRSGEQYGTLRNALSQLSRNGDVPSTPQISAQLGKMREVNVNDLMFVSASHRKGQAIWRLVRSDGSDLPAIASRDDEPAIF